MCNSSTPIPAFSTPTPTLDVQVLVDMRADIEVLMEHFRGQLQRERDLFLALADERERLLGIEPRTAEIRKWWREKRE